MNKTIIHAAYPKTASTWFQKKFYPYVENYTYVGREIYRDKLLFSDKKFFKNIYTNKDIILCEEEIMNIRFNKNDIDNTRKKLFEAFPIAEIVFFIRNQITLFESAYAYYVKSGGTRNYLALINYLFNLKKEQWNYYTQINKYINLFGKNKVHIFLYEDFIESPKDFIKNYCKELNIKCDLNNIDFTKENESLNKHLIYFMKFSNKFSKEIRVYNHPKEKLFFHVPYFHYFSKKIHIKFNKLLRYNRYRIENKQLISKLINYYKTDNRKLVKNFNLVLKKHNYPL